MNPGTNMDDYDYDAFDDIAETFTTDTKAILLSKYKTDGEATHTFINGGKLNIPYENLTEVYQLLEKNKENPPLTERINAYGDTFKFYIDLDDETADVKEVITTADLAINKMFILNDDQKQYTIWKNKNKEKYHIIFQFVCNKEEALNIMDFVSKEIDCELDTSVYHSGLRLPHCNKDTVKEKDNSVYEYFSGLKGSYAKTGSILYTDGIDGLEYSDGYSKYINHKDYKQSPVYKMLYKSNDETASCSSLIDNNSQYSSILDNIFNIENGNWECEKTDKSYKLICLNNKKCLASNDNKHEEQKHSCLLMNKYCITACCFSHGNKKLSLTPELIKLKDLFYPKPSKPSKINKPLALSNIPTDKALTDEQILKMIQSINTTHDDVARIFHYFYGDLFICGAEIPTPQWYFYNKGLWEELDGNSVIRKKLCQDVAMKYLILNRTLVNNSIKRVNDILSDIGNDELLSMASICDEIIIKLKTVAYVDSLMKQCIYMFKVEKFIEKLDGNGYLLCFGEDVYDLEINEWRKTKQDDYCSRKCGVSKDEITNEHLDELNEILNNIFINDNRREYFLNLTAEVLHGGNLKEIFQIWTGTGRNGKGLFMKYLEKALGSYFYTSDVSYLTQRTRPNGNANSELAQSRGVRLWSFTEPAQGAKLNNSLMKAITGGDVISARQLFQKSFNFLPQFTPIIQCNTSFGLQDVADDSIPDRLEFIKFNTRFVSEPTKSFERLKLVGIKTDKYANKIKGALMFLLLNRWKDLSEADFKYTKPEEVVGDKQEFIDDNDDVKQFLDDTYEITDNKDDFMKAKDMFDIYKDYYNDKSGFKCKMNLKTFINRCSKHVDYKERHKKTGIDYRSVFMNIKDKENDDDI
jgi:P4 family phage/plasmid primase-like protien